MTVNLSDEERNLRDRTRAFGDEHIEPVAMEHVESREWPWDVYRKAAEEGLIGLPFAEEYGGQDASLVEQCLVAQEFCRADSSVGIALHGSMTGCFAMSAFGTHEQKQRWLEPVTRGEITTGIGLTEPDSGSALAETTTTAERDGGDYLINGRKDWIANGVSGDWVATLCRTDPDPEKPHHGLSLIVVPTDADGYEAEHRNRLGLDAAEHARIEYDDVRVPQENLLGDEEGQGFYQALEWLEHGRVDIAAAHLGMAEGAFDRALAYAKGREQGGQPIGDYHGNSPTCANRSKWPTARCTGPPALSTRARPAARSKRVSSSRPASQSSTPPRSPVTWPKKRCRCSVARASPAKTRSNTSTAT
jgi:hypothetical protein